MFAPFSSDATKLTSPVATSFRQSHSVAPVKLAFDLALPPKDVTPSADQCLVVCHGLLYVPLALVSHESSRHDKSGSKQNWRSLAKMFAHQLQMKIYTLARSIAYDLDKADGPLGPAEPWTLTACDAAHLFCHGD
jgi:hypothetical protein